MRFETVQLEAQGRQQARQQGFSSAGNVDELNAVHPRVTQTRGGNVAYLSQQMHLTAHARVRGQVGKRKTKNGGSVHDEIAAGGLMAARAFIPPKDFRETSD